MKVLGVNFFLKHSVVAGKRRSLLMAGDDDEVYDKKPERYAEEVI